MPNIKGQTLTLLLIIAFNFAFGQEVNVSKLQNKADKQFAVKNYKGALPMYLELEEAAAEVENLDYKIAKCLFEAEEVNDRIRSIAYFERIDVSTFKTLPHNFYMDFGDAYYQNQQVQEALGIYKKEAELFSNDRRMLAAANKKISAANNALELMRIPKNVHIERLGEGINTEYTEYNPVVSADESVMAFTSLHPVQSKTGEKIGEDIMLSRNETGTWSIPSRVEVHTQNNYGTAGISSDGQEMLIFIGSSSGGSLYKITQEGNTWSRPKPLGRNVQSSYLESTASLTPDQKTIYFASNRPGGYGGMDIYKSVKKDDGTWGKAVNLGPPINTRANEDAPFIHPNMQLLFFTTDGHKGMGGNDIFKSELVNGKWTEPKNMGYPINTTANDNYFTLIADGTRGYFSSDRPGGLGGQDIYYMDMPEDYETIPLTLIKGRILDSETHQPIPTKIYMVEQETNEKIDFVYHPNPETGNYLVILPPNKNYDMIIESDGFLPYTLNIDVPNQKEFYELYQKIYLKTIKHFDVVVGQEVQVKNAFYRTNEEVMELMRREHEASLIQKDSIDEYELMGQLMEASDQAAIDYLMELMLLKNPIDQIDFADSNENLQAARRIYFYDESDESKFEKKEVDGHVIYSLPTMYVTSEAEAQKERIKEEAPEELDVPEEVLKVYFEVGKSDLAKNYESDLNQILDELKENPGFGVEISGYASSDGDEELNEKLSNQRAISVLDYLNHRGIVRRRIVAKGYGATENESESKEEDRRVDVRLVDMRKVL